MRFREGAGLGCRRARGCRRSGLVAGREGRAQGLEGGGGELAGASGARDQPMRQAMDNLRCLR